MKRRRLFPTILIPIALLALLIAAPAPDLYGQVRDPGDVNNDGNCNLVDVMYLLEFLYNGGPAPVPIVEPPRLLGRLIPNGPLEPIARTVRLVVRHGGVFQTFETTTHPEWGTFEFQVPIDSGDWVLVYLVDPNSPANAVMSGLDACEGAPVELHLGALSIASTLTIEDLYRVDAEAVGDTTGAVLFDWNQAGGYLELAPEINLHIDGCAELRALRSAIPSVQDLVVEPGARLVTNYGMLVSGDLLARGEIDTGGDPLWLAGCETAELRSGVHSLPPIVIHKEPGAAVHLEGTGITEILGDLIVNSGRLQVDGSLRVTGWTFVSANAEFEVISADPSVLATFGGPVLVDFGARWRVQLPYGSLYFGSSVQVLDGGLVEWRGAIGQPLVIRSIDRRPWAFTVDPDAETDIRYVDVAYSDASAGRAIIAVYSIDSGQNHNWRIFLGSIP